MRNAEDRNKVDEIWNLIKREHTAVLVSIREDGSLDSIPMGCVQSDFDGTLYAQKFGASTTRLCWIMNNERSQLRRL
jgi:hypothetical protein